MSGRRSISNSFNVITVDDPVSVIAQYAPTDNPSSSQIHNTWQNGDLYMRTKSTEDGATWSSWHKIVGESGDETDYTFGISAYKTTSNASTAPSDISSWSDAPLAVTSAKPYLWAKVQKKSWNASTQSYDVDSTTYIRLTGEDGSSVIAQYAPNNNPSSSQIHDTWQSGDLYMRTKSTLDSNWSSWHKIVGESGDETDYSFNISKSKTSTNPTTAPSNCYYTNWQDAPVAPTSTYPYMWMKIVKKTWNESTQSYDSGTPSYARVTGEKGDKGADAPYIELSRSTILYTANSDGYSTASQNFAITYALKVKGNTCAIASVNDVSISLPSNVTVVSGTKTTSGCTINCTHSKIMSGVITITITGTYDGVAYTATGTITVDSSRQGEQGDPGEPGGTGDPGPRGKVGRFFYYAGIFDVSDTTTQFIVNDAQSPYFAYNNQYWVYNPEANPSGGTATMSAMGTPSSPSSNWKIMTNDFKYLITEAIFGRYAHFGSFIINDDWLISQHGKKNNVDSTDYTSFDPNFAKGCYLCQGVDVDVNYKNVGSNTFIGGKTYYITLIGEGFRADSGVSSQQILNVRMYNGSSTVGSTINLTPANRTQTLTFTPPSTGLYYVRVDMQYGSTHGMITAYVNNVFIPNYAVDALQGTSFQHDIFISGVVESENIEQGNKIVIDAMSGGIKMIGPTSITDDEHLPASNARAILAEIGFDYDPDSLQRTSFIMLKGKSNTGIFEQDRIAFDNPTNGSWAGLGDDGLECGDEDGNIFSIYSHKMSIDKTTSHDKVEITVEGVRIARNGVYTSKTWEEIFTNQ